ncbi:ABC transporter permease [Chryseolinea sp. T2]|uniref:ABC transporter permease n=1 Tax=Chryseolinea sp. T2 TaxID=3129255 RepID=UPI0030778459
MVRNFLLLAYRNLRKRASFSFVNVFGLSLGMCACLTILKYVDFETSYDNFHTHGESIYRMTRTMIQGNERKQPNVMTTYGLGPALQENIPEVKNFVRTHDGNSVVSVQNFSGETKAFHENNILIVDSTFLEAFTFETLAGDVKTPLDNPNSIVLTRSMAMKYFGSLDAIGRDVKLNGGRMNGDYVVSAIIEDVPPNSSFSFRFLLPIHNIFLEGQYKEQDGWGTNNFITYVQLHDQASLEGASARLNLISERYINPKFVGYGGVIELKLQPLHDIHLETGIRHDVPTVSPDTLYFFALIAAFILIIAWINYINLSTARAMERAREVGIMKTVGARRSELIVQFLLESVVINIVAVLLALLLALFFIPQLGEVLRKKLVLDLSDGRLWMVLTLLFISGSLASGVYPAFIMSSYKIGAALKISREDFSLRKVLVVFQFACSLLLLAGTLVVYRQVSFMQAQDTGLQMDQMLVVPGPGTINWEDAKRRLAIFKEEVRRIKGVEAITTSGALPGAGYNWGADIYRVGKEKTDIRLGCVVWVDPDFLATYDIPLVAGRNFDERIASDMKALIVNEASLEAFDLGTPEEALQQKLIMDGDTSSIIGVARNYNWNSLKSEVTPFLFGADNIIPANISIQLNAQELRSATAAIGELYQQLIPGEPFEYYFLDDSFNSQYQSDLQFGKIFGLFATLAIAISCLGLWGLASFTTSQRLKEIGVRKVLGASVLNIIYMLCSQFMKLVVISSILAMPLAWYGMDSWLAQFAFRIELGWQLFVIPFAALACIALLTVGMQVLKGAMMNPAKVLRSE